MNLRTRLTTSLAVLATLGVMLSASVTNARSSPTDDGHDLDGEWIYVEDRTAGRALEQLGPPMSAKFWLRVEEGAIVLVSGHGSGHRDVRVALDGSLTEITDAQKTSRYHGAWTDGVFTYEVDFVRAPDSEPSGLIRREFRITEDGLLVSVASQSPTGWDAVGLYRHAEDIAMPAPAQAVIGDLGWLAGAWVGTRSSGASFEERWSPPLGGAMLGTSRTVSRGMMSAFEYLRIVERDGGLIYVAQPGGLAPTEFVLSELTTTRAVFDNPRHDYPKRITYERTAEGGLTATIGFMTGGTPRRFEFQPDNHEHR